MSSLGFRKTMPNTAFHPNHYSGIRLLPWSGEFERYVVAVLGANMFELARFIESCRNALHSTDPISTVHRIVRDVIEDRKSIVSALRQGRANSETTAQYIFLHQSPELTILQVITPLRFRSPPHNHLVWAVIGMYEGCEKNRFYRRDGNRLREDSVRDVTAPEAITLASDAIHGIANPLDRPSYALHVYGGALTNPERSIWNPFTFEEEPFQLATLSKYEDAMNRQSSGGAT